MSMEFRAGYQSARITTATTTVVKASAGVLHKLWIEVTNAGIITINQTVNGATVAALILPAALPAGAYELDMALSGKIEIVTASADRLVALYI